MELPERSEHRERPDPFPGRNWEAHSGSHLVLRGVLLAQALEDWWEPDSEEICPAPELPAWPYLGVQQLELFLAL